MPAHKRAAGLVIASVSCRHELGYTAGQEIAVEMRFAEGRPERLPALVDELLRLKVDVLVVGATIGARAASQATRTVPIVFAGASDPVAGGIVSELARPGGNITGFSLAIGDGFAGKWLELLSELAPSLHRAAVLWSASNAAASRFVDELQTAARRLNIGLEAHQAKDAAELDVALASISRGGARGLVVTPSPFAAGQQSRLIDFTAVKRLPAVYFSADFAEAGGLASYGPNIVDSYRRAARYVDKILKGARPGDLPVEQATSFEQVVNLKTAAALGLKVPSKVLLRADRVIE